MDSKPHPKDKYSLRKVGRPFTESHRIYFESNHHPISPIHDIPLVHTPSQNGCPRIFNMIVEIPRWTNPKFEISLTHPFNPIHQDTYPSSSSPPHHLRFQPSIHPFTGYPFNYGALPQTWEDPFHPDPHTHIRGDNDPLDACEIGQRIAHTGDVKAVKVLGVLGLIDQEETDWKVVVIDVEDPMAGRVNDVGDVEGVMPGVLEGMRDWFRVYKIPEGGEENKYAFGGEVKGRGFAEGVIGGCHRGWKRLVMGEVECAEASLENTTLEGTPGKMDPGDVDLPPNEDLSPAPIEDDLGRWYFVDREKLDSKEEEESLERSKLEINLELK
ncbi:inorganic pyrophosphatase [Cercophora newfieldiana]|uniref:inorganic diphosphatase n=1 Tax=Cercophora newfieldiana TaxID=92897 RepID=A0AA39Y120_9PEZI|nr:inorganic pyrophosphatase [Cercophora newfieldiana]